MPSHWKVGWLPSQKLHCHTEHQWIATCRIRNWVARTSPVHSMTRDPILLINSLALDPQAPKFSTHTGKKEKWQSGMKASFATTG